MIVESIEISRSPEHVFAYATDFSHFPEWQAGVLSARKEGQSRATVVRRAGPRKLTRTEELVEQNAPKSWTVRGVGGPLIATVKGTIEPIDGGERSRVTIALDFEAHDLGGSALLPLLRRVARKQ